MFQRGDIVSVNFPFTDMHGEKLRPAIIISNEIVNQTGDVIIVMITSKFKMIC
jgi:mRNA interferase MazF